MLDTKGGKKSFEELLQKWGSLAPKNPGMLDEYPGLIGATIISLRADGTITQEQALKAILEVFGQGEKRKFVIL